MKTKYHVAVVLDSAEACRIYAAATGGGIPPLPPAGTNTTVTPFTVRDPDGNARAAVAIVQTDWAQSPSEAARGEETDGASVAVATDAPEDEGAALLRDWVDCMLRPGTDPKSAARALGMMTSPKKAAASARNGRLGGRRPTTEAGQVRKRLRGLLEGAYGTPLPKDGAVRRLLHTQSTPSRRAKAWAEMSPHIPEDRRAAIESVLAELDELQGGV